MQERLPHYAAVPAHCELGDCRFLKGPTGRKEISGFNDEQKGLRTAVSWYDKASGERLGLFGV